MMKTWQLQDAKSRFSEVVDRAMTDGVQIVTRRGKKAVAIIPVEEYERLTRREGSLANFLLDSPLRGSQLDLQRDQDQPRNIEIEP